MDRKKFLKSACSYGLCGCFGLSLISCSPESSESAESQNDQNDQNEEEEDWRVEFMQSRYRVLLNSLDETLDEETIAEILGRVGAKCGEGYANEYKNDPEGFFSFIKSEWAESVDYDKEAGIITVNELVRDNCNCPFIPKKDAPAILCNCSLGTQKKIYESLFSRPVSVTLNKSVLRGDERCSFTIQLL